MESEEWSGEKRVKRGKRKVENGETRDKRQEAREERGKWRDKRKWRSGSKKQEKGA